MVNDRRYNSPSKQTNVHSVFINNAASQFKKTLKMLYAKRPNFYWDQHAHTYEMMFNALLPVIS